jgi:glycosyltransferase involved in cell wall biosynthesis
LNVNTYSTLIDFGLSIIIPAYNEERGIAVVLKQLSRVCTRVDFPCEIIVVDDGSTDGTAARIESQEGVCLLQHRDNRGYGAALKTGIRHAKYDLICISDADGTYPHDIIPHLVDRINRADFDMVVGARIGDGAQIPLLRRPAKWALTQLAQAVAGEEIPDLNSGLRVFKRNAALKFMELLPQGFSYTTTITLAMITNGYLVDYIPIEYHARIGKSKIRPIRDTLRFIDLVLRIALYFAPLKIFLPLSGFLMALAVIWGVFSIVFLKRLADTSTIIIAMAAVQVAVVGLLAELIVKLVPGYKLRNDIR